MSFPESVVRQAWNSAGGRCECTRENHGHYGRCGKQLVWENRGRETGRGDWEAHHRVAGGPDVASNCEILCWDCHKKTRTFGR